MNCFSVLFVVIIEIIHYCLLVSDCFLLLVRGLGGPETSLVGASYVKYSSFSLLFCVYIDSTNHCGLLCSLVCVWNVFFLDFSCCCMV